MDADTVLDQDVGIFRAGGVDVVDGHIELKPIRHRCALIQAPEQSDHGTPMPSPTREASSRPAFDLV